MNSEHVERTLIPGPVEQVLAVDALIAGMEAASISRLFLVGDFAVLDEEPADDVLQRHAAEEVLDALNNSTLQWTLIDSPYATPGLSIEHFSQVSTSLEAGMAESLERLGRVAVGIADELRLNLHVGQHVSFVAAD